MRSPRALALTVALSLPSIASAQLIDARPLFPYGNRNESVQTVVTTLRPRLSARGDLTLKVARSWPRGDARVAQSISVSAGSARSFVTPAPVGPYDYAEASFNGASTSVPMGSNGGAVPSPTWIAVVGLGGRITAAIEATNRNEGDSAANVRVIAATALNDPGSGDPILPPIPSAYGGTHSLIIGSAAVLAAPPEARRALADWVLAGGFLAIAPRAISDLRDPWFVSLLGDVIDDGDGRIQGRRLLARRWGAMVHHGLGIVGVIPHDLSSERWAQDPRAEAALRDYVDFADGAGGGMVAPGDLSLFRRLSHSGDDRIRAGFQPPADVRGLLIPVAILLALYVVGVGVALGRNLRGRSPLKVFVWMPLAAFAVLATVFIAARVTRTSASAARVLAVYDMGEGSPRAVERVFAALNAGSATTLSLTPPGEGVALYTTSASSGSTAMRWDGARLGVERVRLGLWESGLVYTERVMDAGGGIRVVRDGPAVRLVNHSPWALSAAVYLHGGNVGARFPAAPPGATVTGTIETRGLTTIELLFTLAPGDSELPRVFVQRMLDSLQHVRGADQVFAIARLPDDVRSYVRALGFAPKLEGALVRVVIPEQSSDPERVGAYSARIGARRANYDGPEEEPVVATEAPPETSRADAGTDASEASAP